MEDENRFLRGIAEEQTKKIDELKKTITEAIEAQNKLQKENEELKEENEKLKEKVEVIEWENGGLRDEVDRGEEIIGDRNEEIYNLKEEKKWADGLTARQIHEIFLSKEELLEELEKTRKTNLMSFSGMCEAAQEVDKLKEENKKLKNGGGDYISRKDHQKVTDFLNDEAEKYKLKFMEASKGKGSI